MSETISGYVKGQQYISPAETRIDLTLLRSLRDGSSGYKVPFDLSLYLPASTAATFHAGRTVELHVELAANNE